MIEAVVLLVVVVMLQPVAWLWGLSHFKRSWRV